jgi:hypothetical protein
MINRSCFLKILILLIGYLFTYTLNASSIEREADKTIEALYHNPKLEKNRNLTDKMVWFSKQFLGKAYLLGALGEGQTAYFDQFPLYRVDAFDCETYVDTVLALAMGKNLTTFKEKLLKIRYKAGKRAYIHRNHFTDLDWNHNNQIQGFVKDITTHFKKIQIQWASTNINKPSWYAKRPINAIRIISPNLEMSKQRLKELHQRGTLFSTQKAVIPYLPLTGLFDTKGNAKTDIFNQIPQAAIIEIIRPNWNVEKAIGTNLNVSHLGFAIWKNNQLYFREASSEYGEIVDVSLISYLKNLRDSQTIKGINVQVAL